MSAMPDAVVVRVLELQVRLLACQARLAADTDSEALHDLRTGVRRLRSLLRPLKGVPGVEQLDGAASALGQLTTPLRDREVLAAQLLERQQTEAARQRLAGRQATFAGVAASAQLERLLAILDAFPIFLRAAERERLLAGLRKRIDKRLSRQWKHLFRALHDPAHDRHRLRLLVKRIRYGADAYPQLQPLGKKMRGLLKQTQDDLGHWHDLIQWLHQAEQHADLAPCVAHWQDGLVAAEQRADRTLERLLKAIDRR